MKAELDRPKGHQSTATATGVRRQTRMFARMIAHLLSAFAGKNSNATMSVLDGEPTST
jgi:hypothetical protein